MAKRKYSNYKCGQCNWTKKILTINDPGLNSCPSCNRKNSFYVKYTEEKVKRGKIKRKR